MHIVKILKRKDAASIIVAIALAFVLLSIMPVMTSDLATYLSGITDAPTLDWRESVVMPLINAFLQIILLEAILRVTIFVRPYFVRRKTGKR